MSATPRTIRSCVWVKITGSLVASLRRSRAAAGAGSALGLPSSPVRPTAWWLVMGGGTARRRGGIPGAAFGVRTEPGNGRVTSMPVIGFKLAARTRQLAVLTSVHRSLCSEMPTPQRGRGQPAGAALPTLTVGTHPECLQNGRMTRIAQPGRFRSARYTQISALAGDFSCKPDADQANDPLRPPSLLGPTKTGVWVQSTASARS